MKKIILLLFVVISATAKSQTIFMYRKTENSATTEAKMNNAKIFLDKAYQAYNENDMKKCRYYLYQSEENGYVNDAFYFLLGQWSMKSGNNDAAIRYWMRGYKKHGCWDCKELADKLKSTLNGTK